MLLVGGEGGGLRLTVLEEQLCSNGLLVGSSLDLFLGIYFWEGRVGHTLSVQGTEEVFYLCTEFQGASLTAESQFLDFRCQAEANGAFLALM